LSGIDPGPLGLCVEPADRPRAEAAIAALYRRDGLRPPRFVWAASPLAGAFAAALEEASGMSGERLECIGGVEAWGDRLMAASDCWPEGLGESYQALVDGLVAGLEAWLQDGFFGTLLAQSTSSGRPSESEPLRDRILGLARGAFLGQHVGDWVVRAWRRRRRLAGRLPLGSRALEAVVEVAASAGWWWPFEGLVVISDRPALLRTLVLPRRTRTFGLHALDGPAARFRDGWSVYAIENRVAPRILVEAPTEATPSDLLGAPFYRQVMHLVARFGEDRFLAEGRPLILDADRDAAGMPRRLLHFAAPDFREGVLAIVEVVCPSTARRHLLRVPPRVRTCHQAVAWTFGLLPSEYRPGAEA